MSDAVPVHLGLSKLFAAALLCALPILTRSASSAGISLTRRKTVAESFFRYQLIESLVLLFIFLILWLSRRVHLRRFPE